jgi:hypothetical protein
VLVSHGCLVVVVSYTGHQVGKTNARSCSRQCESTVSQVVQMEIGTASGRACLGPVLLEDARKQRPAFFPGEHQCVRFRADVCVAFAVYRSDQVGADERVKGPGNRWGRSRLGNWHWVVVGALLAEGAACGVGAAADAGASAGALNRV